MSRDWIEVCAAYLEAAGRSRRGADPLRAFGRARERAYGGDFESLEREMSRAGPALSGRIVAALDGEVDEAQARMFARRLQAVRGQLEALAARDEGARVLAVGLAARAEEILAGPAPRALRIRALADYYYSRAGVLFHALERSARGEPALSLEQLAGAARWEAVARGVAWAHLAGQTPEGPANLNLLRVDPALARLSCVDCRASVEAGQSFPALVADRGAVAGTSGGYFLYSEADITPPSRRYDPVGLLLHAGRVLSPPVWRRASLLLAPQGDTQRAQIAVVGPGEVALHLGPRRLTIAAVNAPRPAAAVAAYSRAGCERSPEDPGALALAVVGDRVIARGCPPLPVPLGGLVLHLPGDAPALEGPLRWAPPTAGPPGAEAPASEGIAGGPLLVVGGRPCLDLPAEDFCGSAPPQTFSGDETGDRNLLPRMGLGQLDDGALIFAAADGRNFHRALGLTLGGLSRLLVALGCHTAMNLDGGSSKRMVIGDRAVDLPSTEVVDGGDAPARVRPVHTAVLVYAGRR